MTLDIALGIFSVIFVTKIFGIDLSNQLLVLGILFNLLPDMDFIFHLLSGNNIGNAHLHRDLLHRPLLYIPIGVSITYFISPVIGVLFGITSLLHFIHDSIGIGWGVEWLYPFKRNHLAFLYVYSPKGRKIPDRILYNWRHQEIDGLSKKYGDKDWIKNIYFKFHPYAIFEHVIFIISIVVLLLLKVK